VKVKAIPKVVSIMVSMDEEARHHFSERANKASERNEAAQQEKKELQLLEERKAHQWQAQRALKIKQQKKGVSYWLFSASFAEIFKKLRISH
jgi:hypothetical protein